MLGGFRSRKSGEEGRKVLKKETHEDLKFCWMGGWGACVTRKLTDVRAGNSSV